MTMNDWPGGDTQVYLVAIAGDGDCLFTSIAYGLVQTAQQTGRRLDAANVASMVLEQMDRIVATNHDYNYILTTCMPDLHTPVGVNNSRVRIYSKYLRALVAWSISMVNVTPAEGVVPVTCLSPIATNHRQGLETIREILYHHPGDRDLDVQYGWINTYCVMQQPHQEKEAAMMMAPPLSSPPPLNSWALAHAICQSAIYWGDDMAIDVLQDFLRIRVVCIGTQGSVHVCKDSVDLSLRGSVLLMFSGRHYDIFLVRNQCFWDNDQELGQAYDCIMQQYFKKERGTYSAIPLRRMYQSIMY